MSEVQAALSVAVEALALEAQIDLIQKDGAYIGKVKQGTGTMLLYQYQSIYVEVHYAVHRSDITAVRCFADTTILDRYLASDATDEGHIDPGK
jgi:hypothetical protein